MVPQSERFRRRFFSLFALFAVAGCQSNPHQPAPAVLAVPSVEWRVHYYTGTPLSGPRATAAVVGKPADVLAVQVSLFALDKLPPDRLNLLGGVARLIVARRGADPVLPSSQLTQGTLIAVGDDAEKLENELNVPPSPHASLIARPSGVLPPGVTAAFDMAEGEGPRSPRRIVELKVYRPPLNAASTEHLQVSVTIEDQSVVSIPATTQPAALRSETALIDRGLAAGHDHVVLLIPLELNGSPAKIFAAALDVSPAADQPSHTQAVADCVKALAASAAEAAKRPDFGPIEGSEWAGYEAALTALAQPSQRRGALAFLAGQTQAHICLDTVLTADDATLDTLSQTITRRVSDPTLEHTNAALAWALDDSAFSLLASLRMNQAGPRMLSELDAVLTLYAGEAGRHGSSLEEIVRHLTSRQDLENHLIAENMVYLTDSSPSARVRAYDWLRSRSLAPADFDPLGPIRQRRESLDKAEKLRAEQAAHGTQTSL